MSRQNIKPRLEIVPDEISGPPGEAEASEIRRLYQIANGGIKAFVLMGFRLIDVKARLPHGQYMVWVEKNLPDLSHRQIHKSRQIAETIALRLGWANWNHGSNLNELPAEVCELIDGKSARALLADLHDFEPDPNEEECRKLCEARWKKNAVERDEWEPRVLSGELSYHRALTGMIGHEETAGKTKQDTRHGEVLSSASNKLLKHFPHFEKLPVKSQAMVIERLQALAESMPEACRKAMIETWVKGGVF